MKSKYGNAHDKPFPKLKFRQEGQGKSGPTSNKVARAPKGSPTGDRPDTGIVLGKKNA